MGTLGNIYLDQEDYQKAIEFYEQGLVIARELQNHDSEKRIMESLQRAYSTQQIISFEEGYYGKAIELSQKSLAISQQLQDSEGQADALNTLGVVYGKLGNYERAIDYHKQSLKIAREIQDSQGEAYSLGNLGSAYQRLKDYSVAIELYEKSLVIKEKIKDNLGQAHTLGNLGLLYTDIGNYDKAIDYHEQALNIAIKISDRRTEGKALGHIGNIYLLLKNYTEAIDYYQQSLAVKRIIADQEGEASTLVNLGNTFRLLGNLVQAEKTLRESIQLWESIRTDLGKKDTEQVSFFDTYTGTYILLQKILITQNKVEDALEIAESGRARAFVELLARRISTTNDSANSPITPPTIEQLQQIAKQQNATLVEYSIIYEQLQAKEIELYIWVIKPTGEITFRKVDLTPLWQEKETSLAELVFTTRNSLGVRGLRVANARPRPGTKAEKLSHSQRLQQLHQLLIQPIADLLPTNPNERIIFLPQGSLFLVPFPALQDEQGKYLIEQHTILTAPAIQVLQLTREQQQKLGTDTGKSLVVGNPTMPSVRPDFDKPPEPLSPLPGAEEEAKAVAKFLNTQPLIGNQATETSLVKLLPQARIIHLATHGLLDEIRGIGSAIALAPSNEDDGLLTAEEILELDLNAELVVLSACDTGRGRITGDGVVGLSRSLISAGTASVLVSLWQVPDDSTAFLMTKFYENLEQNPDKAQALRQAMLTTMKEEQYSHPLQWAAFTLIGEAD